MCVVFCWSRGGREDGVYQPVSMSARARLAEGRAGRAGRSPGRPRPAGRPRGTGTGRPTRTKAPPGGRAVAGGPELSVLPPQRLLRSLSHPGTTLWGASVSPALVLASSVGISTVFFFPCYFFPTLVFPSTAQSARGSVSSPFKEREMVPGPDQS